MIQASIEFKQNMIYTARESSSHQRLFDASETPYLTAKPTRVAIELLQLHDLKNKEAAHKDS